MAEPMSKSEAARKLRGLKQQIWPLNGADLTVPEICVVLDDGAAELDRLTTTLATETAAREAAERVANEAEEDSENSLHDLETAIAERKTAEASLDVYVPGAQGAIRRSEELLAAGASKDPLTFTYRNWRGEIGDRRVHVLGMRWGASEWHPEPQWLLRAWDLGKSAEREFAVRDMAAVGTTPAPLDTRVRAALRAARDVFPRPSVPGAVSKSALAKLRDALAALPPGMLEGPE